MPDTPEARARQNIDWLLTEAGIGKLLDEAMFAIEKENQQVLEILKA